jgi:carbon monoxide dehydrogenase subunit G
MDITIIDDSDSKGQRTSKAATGKLDISINLEKITAKTTQIKVDARKNIVLKDKATAAEIIHQVAEKLENTG